MCRVHVGVRAFDQTVGVESEDTAPREFEIRDFGGQTTQAERWAGRRVQEIHGAVRSDERRRGPARAMEQRREIGSYTAYRHVAPPHP
ncbi:hypothetical protein ADK35_24300 [Streptomyces viridochromogenes]|nr:hypothetical protein ADK36_26820 [Streptomyces viridochromogenes]KOG17332.1 hypothetical protein ADK35_24300 [Streptomyces viridochromogenes]